MYILTYKIAGKNEFKVLKAAKSFRYAKMILTRMINNLPIEDRRNIFSYGIKSV